MIMNPMIIGFMYWVPGKPPIIMVENHLDDCNRQYAMDESQLEANFATEFYAKFGDKRGKWELSREDEVILLGDTVMIPDFALTHRDSGQRILIEIMGFWHPDYLRRKLKKVHDANLDNLLLLVYEDVNLTAPTSWKTFPQQSCTSSRNRC